MRRKPLPARRGSILPLAALSVTVLFAFVALAIDIGMLTIARTQCQNVADLSAAAGARTLDGSSGNNSTAAKAKVVTTAKTSSILSQPVQDSQVTPTIGKYYYDRGQAKFVLYPNDTSTNPSTENWTMAQSAITVSVNPMFASLLVGHPSSFDR
jgi:uncharacterized membrane protein